MIFHRTIEKLYQAQMLVRCDDKGIAYYFSEHDFPGLEAEPYTFLSSLGHTMKGYFYSYPNYDEARLVIFEHGFGGGHRSYMKEIERLCQAGFRVFAYDHTGCMESGGAGAGGFGQSLHDLDDCLTALKADENVNTDRISVMGHSWGGFSTLNISAFHPDVEKIVVLCGFVSVEQIVAQNFSGLLKGYRKHIMALEQASNPTYASYNGAKTLQQAEVKALLIYDKDDPLVQKAYHYDVLYSQLKEKDNITFLLTEGKGHNPNYTHDAVKCLAELAQRIKREASGLKTEPAKKAFVDSFDWHCITAQDEEIWGQIIDFLK